MIKIEYEDAPESVREFLKYKLTIQNKSEKTCFQYYHDLRGFFRFMLVLKHKKKYEGYAIGDLSFNEVTDKLVYSVTGRDVSDYLAYCAKELQNGEAARNRKLSCLRSFYKYLCSNLNEKKLEKNPLEHIESPKRKKALPKFLTLEESKKLLECIEPGKNFERDYAIITIFLNCGLRVSELCGINLRDIHSDFEAMRVVGKGNKERVVYLNDACVSAIKAYLAVRPTNAHNADKNALFISRNMNRISDKTVQWLVYKYLQAAGLNRPGMSVHKLRHTAATLMYQYGKTDVRTLKDILGHEELSTTEIYTHVSNEQMKSAALSNPLSQIKAPKKRKDLKDIIENDEDEEI